jgi:hypothetical protein
MIELTEEQRRLVDSGQAVDVLDSESTQSYVVVRKDVYERARRLICDDSEWTEEELRQQLARSAKENGWEEPEMQAYDHYDQELRKRCP